MPRPGGKTRRTPVSELLLEAGQAGESGSVLTSNLLRCYISAKDSGKLVPLRGGSSTPFYSNESQSWSTNPSQR